MTSSTATRGGPRVQLCGAFAVSGADGHPIAVGSPKARLLLTRLAAARGATVGVEELVELLWPGQRPRHPEDNVATLVSRLRALLGADVVLGGRAGYRIGPVSVDIDEAGTLAGEARRRLTAGQAGLALAAARRGLELLSDGRPAAGEAAWLDVLGIEVGEQVRTLRHLVAEAAPAAGEPTVAVDAARAAAVADPLDERAHELLMQAYVAAGEPHRALAVFEALRGELAAALGVDPCAAVRDLHVAILQERAVPEYPPNPQAARVHEAPAGREAELSRLAATWSAAAAGHPALLHLVGEAGIGKTTLAQALARIAAATGGLVLQARCYAAERSLFLQPLLDAIDPLLDTLTATEIRRLAGPGGPALAGLLPGYAGLLGEAPHEEIGADLQRRRAYDALRGFLHTLATDRPVLLLLDDLHNAKTATLEMPHYLARRMGGSRLLLLTTVRQEEGATALADLGSAGSRLDVGPLGPEAVTLLATRAGMPGHARDLLRRTRGHTLFVVETLRALRSGEQGVPASLRDTVAARLRHAGPDVERVLRAGSVLGASVAPDLVAQMTGMPAPAVVQLCEAATAARLLVPAGERYEFANDLVQEALYVTTPQPTRFAHHRSAADLLTDRPESLAGHAEAVADWPRAADAWLAAGRRAIERSAVADARVLLDRAWAAAHRVDESALTGRVHLARADVLAAQADYPAAVADLGSAVAAFRLAGDRDHEMAALRRYAGDLGGALRRSELDANLAVGAQLAEDLDDPCAQADLYAGQAIIAANRLRFVDALELGHRAAAAGRRSGSDTALAAGLDGLKTAYAYLGDTATLRAVLAELEPLVRRLGSSYVLSWLTFESALLAIADADWELAADRIDASVEINRRNGMRAQEAWLVAHRGWVERLRGRLGTAVDHGRRAVTIGRAAPHGWWAPTANALLATTLLELDETAEAVRLLTEGRAVAQGGGMEAYVLRCAAPLAVATGSPDDLAVADALLGGIHTPPGGAWLAGGDAYVSVARAWQRQGDARRARAALAPLLVAARRHGWRPWLDLQDASATPGG
ncbi:ATP-binding protein [Pseudonocardia sp.]|uniref:ATP-binding protein n=1 Tax=Pseudonocardia sp. TaxID=60912 RepID=UPI003D13AF8D